MNARIKNFLTIATLTSTVFITACATKDRTTNNVNGLNASGGPVSNNTVSQGVVNGSPVDKNSTISGSTISETSIYAGQPSQDEKNNIRTKSLLAEIKKQQYANDYNIYESDKMNGIYQYSLKGKEEIYYNTSTLSLPEIVWVDNDCIIYFCDYDDEDIKPKFFYAPITGKKGQRKVQTAKKIQLDCGKEYEYFIAKKIT